MSRKQTTPKDRTRDLQPSLLTPAVWPAALLIFAALAARAEETRWHVKAFHPKGRLLEVQAFDKQGKIHAVTASQEDDRFHLLDVEALFDGKRLPVRVLVSDDRYAPAKAIGDDGTIYDVHALTPAARVYDIKGIKMTNDREETRVSRVAVAAHIKALPPAPEGLK